jgi:hypothetical protein
MNGLPTGLRDHPGVLIAAVAALVGCILGLGYLTARVGCGWARTYAYRQTVRDSQ